MSIFPHSPEKLTIAMSKRFVNYLMDDFTLIHPKYTNQGKDLVYTEPVSLDIGDELMELPLFPEVEELLAKAMEKWPGGMFVRIAGKAFKDC